MSTPRPESRISSLEHRASTIEAQIIEMSNDTAEELKAIRQDIKKLSDGITDSYKSIGDTFIALEQNIYTRFDQLEASIATKDDIAELKDLIKQLLQQKPGEGK